MTLTSPELSGLKRNFAGTLIAADDPDYDDARRLWNADHDGRPAVIARCSSAADVAAAVRFAQERGLELAVRGGAHSTAGSSTADGGLVVDLSAMNAVRIDADRRRAHVGGGALLADLDAAAQEHSLVTPAGMVSHTGVGGLTVGGGMGWLTRRHGLTIDNLLSVEVVLADGRTVHCSNDQEPDLFWAVRGAGANFGVVTEFEFALHPLDTMVSFGLYFWPLERGGDVLRRVRDIYNDATLSRDVMLTTAALNAPPAPFVPAEHHFAPGYAVLVVSYAGPELQAQTTARVLADLPPLFQMETPMPFVELQRLLDETYAWGILAYEKGTYLPELTDAAIDIIVEHVPAKNSPLSALLFYRLDGAFCEVEEDATAFGGRRTPQYGTFILDVAPDRTLLEADRAWVRSLWSALQPHSVVNGAGYVNSMAEYDDARTRATYGAKYDRLTALKARYDPHNVFHRTANIRPSAR
jgi:FAD/FMN-containing dehydrogenase